MKVIVAQSCLTLCDPMDCTGILQARIQSGEPIPSPADLPDPGIEPGSPALQVDSLPTELFVTHRNSLCCLGVAAERTNTKNYMREEETKEEKRNKTH